MTQKAKDLEHDLKDKDQERDKLETHLRDEKAAHSASQKELQGQIVDLRTSLKDEQDENASLKNRNTELEEELVALIELLKAEQAEATARLSRLGQHLERPRIRKAIN
jgi:hypothetical protein